jgi:hypothetical protein
MAPNFRSGLYDDKGRESSTSEDVHVDISQLDGTFGSHADQSARYTADLADADTVSFGERERERRQMPDSVAVLFRKRQMRPIPRDCTLMDRVYGYVTWTVEEQFRLGGKEGPDRRE